MHDQISENPPTKVTSGVTMGPQGSGVENRKLEIRLHFNSYLFIFCVDHIDIISLQFLAETLKSTNF